MATTDPPSGLLAYLGDHPLVTLTLLLAVALRLGRLEVWGVSLGTSAVVFVALLFGHWGLTIPSGLGSVGLVVFVYAVGLDAGPGFFRPSYPAGGRSRSLRW